MPTPELHQFVLRRLDSMEQNPRIWALSKEAFVAQLTLLLELYQCPEAHELYEWEFCGVRKPTDRTDKEWGKTVIIKARNLIEKRMAQNVSPERV